MSDWLDDSGPPPAPAGGSTLPVPPWADPESDEFDPLLALNWPPLHPPTPAAPPAAHREWDGTLRLLTAAAAALLAARPAFVSTAALAARLGVTVGTVRRMIREGRVQAVKRGTAAQARLYIPADEADRLAAGRPPA